MSFLAAKSNQELGQWIILMYHKIGDEYSDYFSSLNIKVFEKQIRFLRRFYPIVSLDDLFSTNLGKTRKTKIAITFDDGYHCIYRYAYPILKKWSIPATVFLAVSSIENDLPIWTDLVDYYLKSGGKARQEFPDKDTLKTLPEVQLRVVLKKLEEKIRLPADIRGALQMCSWSEIREMSENNITFGGHTVTHPILSKVSLEQAKYEIQQSKKAIEDKINKPVNTFAYPNGQPDDFNAEIKQLVKDAGYKLACSTIFGRNYQKTDPYELKRIYTSGNSILKFALRLWKAN